LYIQCGTKSQQEESQYTFLNTAKFKYLVMAVSGKEIKIRINQRMPATFWHRILFPRLLCTGRNMRVKIHDKILFVVACECRTALTLRQKDRLSGL
jgi:hypothetical protein